MPAVVCRMEPLRNRLTPAACLPDDAARATLIGRAWLPAASGPALVRIAEDGVYDLSRVAPTATAFFELPDPIGAIRRARSPRPIAALADVLANSAADVNDPTAPYFL